VTLTLRIAKVKGMENETLGLVGGLLGAAVGIAGGIVGTYYGIRNTNGPKEKSYMIKLALAGWVVLAGLITVSLLFIPAQYKSYYSLLYILVLFLAIKYGNKKQQEIRELEK
jgi:Ca2+/Na+ antiporter